MLTKKQLDLLLFINKYNQDTGMSPSFEEMKAGLELKSKSGIHRLINALVERGFLERLPNKARALEVRKLPEGMQNNTAPAQNSNNVRTLERPAPKTALKQQDYNPANESIAIPLYGKIAAGTPIEALRPDYDSVDIPMSMVGSSGSQGCYALTVEGDSMIKAGIMDGDIVIIEKCDRANDGDIVVALVDEEEATLKRLRREIGTIVLMPENDAYEPIRLSPHRVRIQGRIRSLLRNY